MTTATIPQAPAQRRGLRAAGPFLGTVPFFLYTALFLLLPTAIVVIGAFQDKDGGFSFENIAELGDASVLDALWNSVVLSLVTAVIGAVVGGVLAYVLTTTSPTGAMRRLVTAACSVLAQFGGALLAFAFIATIGANGLISRFLEDSLGTKVAPDLLSTLSGLIPVYLYFQIPLMVIVFLPAVDGLRPQWREAAETLGGSTWVYWRKIGFPLLMPSFLGSLLLLFANAFSAYATAAALISQYNPLIALQVRGKLIAETGLGAPNVAKALALLMVLVVAILMVLYYWLQRRASRWSR
ncbi:ABC transporter permease [Nakamurella sp. YIM 132087]|uniref:ABC transporter permease n=1 Tax=Nakamurella alba TaxID=2665158 RepID=A0A7K1FSI4_9ACTN|nr:ABC transporter permease subunit [Nakamurella alba]MTD16133.1 ABC transporter permease [Nakamurella alba]